MDYLFEPDKTLCDEYSIKSCACIVQGSTGKVKWKVANTTDRQVIIPKNTFCGTLTTLESKGAFDRTGDYLLVRKLQ